MEFPVTDNLPCARVKVSPLQMFKVSVDDNSRYWGLLRAWQLSESLHMLTNLMFLLCDVKSTQFLSKVTAEMVEFGFGVRWSG